MILTDGRQVQVYFGDGDVQSRGIHLENDEFMYLGLANSTPHSSNGDSMISYEEGKLQKEVIFETAYAILAFSNQGQVNSLIDQLNHLKQKLPK